MRISGVFDSGSSRELSGPLWIEPLRRIQADHRRTEARFHIAADATNTKARRHSGFAFFMPQHLVVPVVTTHADRTCLRVVAPRPSWLIRVIAGRGDPAVTGEPVNREATSWFVGRSPDCAGTEHGLRGSRCHDCRCRSTSYTAMPTLVERFSERTRGERIGMRRNRSQ